MTRVLPLLLLSACTVDLDGVQVWFVDEDGDGYGQATFVLGREAPAGQWSNRTGDCDDKDETRNPEAVETCNGLDDNCDFRIDEEVGEPWYIDRDGDGFGGAQQGIACSVPAGGTDNDQDCDDSDAEVYPGARELCDGVDNDCDASNGVDLLAYCGASTEVVEAQGRRYLVHDGEMSQIAGRDFCAERGYALLSVQSTAEEQAIELIIGDRFLDATVWMGAVSGFPCGTGWFWYDPLSEQDCTPFGDFEPVVDDADGFGAVFVVPGATWFYDQVTDAHRVVCEQRD